MKSSVKKSVKANKRIPVNKKSSNDKQAGSSKLFPIVAIGSSAGGLESYSKILTNLRPDTGMAFVIIQHLSPDYKSLLKDILKRKTNMPVITVKSGMKPQPDNIYISPPTYSIEIKKGIFRLKFRAKNPRGFKPIDNFMQSLAEDDRHFSIGIILSGSDSDGVIGMEHIKTMGGITYAQNRKTAKFFDMPGNTIAAGVVDFVLSPQAIAKDLNRISNNEHIRQALNDPSNDKLDEHMVEVLSIIHSYKNIDFRHYKPATVRRRILRRMVMNKIKKVTDYIEYLRKNHMEIDSLSSDILIKVTRFFRDPEMYQALKEEIFPKIFNPRRGKDQVRLWVTACSSGQEAYSLAMSIAEYLGPKISQYNIQIFSTDLNEAGIDRARLGIYDEDIKDEVSEERLKKFFTKTDTKYKINKNIRKLCVFAKQNFIQDPPFSKIDLISCRNVLIYMSANLQNKVMPIFHYALKDGSYLMLGSSESIGKWKHLFEAVDRKNKIFSKIPYNFKSGYEYFKMEIFNLDLDKSPVRPASVNSKEFQSEIDRLIHEKYTPAGVVINKNLEVLHFKGDTTPYLEIKEGFATYDFLKLIRHNLAQPLKLLISEAITKNRTVRKNNIRFYTNNEWKNLNIMIDPIFNNSTKFKSYFILFENSDQLDEAVKYDAHSGKPGLKKAKKDFEHISRELAIGREDLQAAVEKQAETKQELQSANEELQSANEELQSSNEELETMKEELQSTNEELITVNEELRERNLQLSNVNSDLNNILSSIKISIVIVDHQLRIKRFTKDAGKLLNILHSDIGRKITDINLNVVIKNLKGIIKEVIETPETKILEVIDDKNFFYSMRIRPYKTAENKIEGATITFVDISEIKERINLELLQKESNKVTRSLERLVENKTRDLEMINIDLTSEITDRKQAEFSLKKLSKNLIDTQETERLKLSRDLHDSVNQLLSIAKLKIHNVENSFSKNSKETFNLKSVSEAKNYVVKAIEEVRRLSKDLRPSTLDDFGINAAIIAIVEDFKIRTGTNIIFRSRNLQTRLSKEIELSLYRIVQESLHNIEKHSGAENVRMSLSLGRSQLSLIISDDGKGFINNRSKLISLKKFGLIGIKERTESLGGKFTVVSEKGLGTKLEIKIPFVFKN